MAELYAVKGKSLTSIADAIREKTGSAEKLELSEMPGAIRAIQAGGGSYDEGFAAGKQAEYDAFWDAFQDYGNMTAYKNRFFGDCWNDGNFYPKYDMKPTGAESMFQGNSISDLTGRLKECGVVLDFSNCTTVFRCFSAGKLTDVPVVDTRATRNTEDLHLLFANAALLTRIEKIILKDDGSQTFTGMFAYCSALEEVRFEGVIGKNTFDVSPCSLLTHDSLMSIINCLKDYSGSGETYSVTLGATNLAKLTDAEKMQAVNKGWTLVGWTPPTWSEGDTCPACGVSYMIDENGRCSGCGHSIPDGKRICSCGGEIGEDCVCASCGKTWHHSEGPDCAICGTNYQ